MSDNKDEGRKLIALNSYLTERRELFSQLGKSYSGSRDLYKALGYSKSLEYSDYFARYTRQDVAKRIIDLPVSATWRKRPELVESEDEQTPFEKKWEELVKSNQVFHHLSKVDTLSGIGRYGVLLIGAGDGKSLVEPLRKASDVLYLKAFSESNVSISSWEKDVNNSRYGLPHMYNLTLLNAERTNSQPMRVHHSRIIHVADGLQDNIYGTPKLECIFNRLQDLEMVAGSSAEMFWRGGFPGLAFKMDKDSDPSTLDLDDIKDEITEYLNDFNRYIRVQGIEIKSLAPQVSDPSNHVAVLLDIISAGVGIPKRILIGSERGELASSQDEKAWLDKVDERRRNYVEPMILRPFVDRLIEVGVLPKPKEDYTVEWADLQVPSETEEAEVARIRMEALAKYVSAPGADQIIPPEIFLKKIMKFSKTEIEQILDSLESGLNEDVAE